MTRALKRTLTNTPASMYAGLGSAIRHTRRREAQARRAIRIRTPRHGADRKPVGPNSKSPAGELQHRVGSGES